MSNEIDKLQNKINECNYVISMNHNEDKKIIAQLK